MHHVLEHSAFKVKLNCNCHIYIELDIIYNNLSTEILAEAEYLSVDPYMRAYMIGYKLPTVMIGEQVAK